MPNRLADTVFWTFGAIAAVWFVVCVVFRVGGETRAEYFLGGILGAAALWGCGWLARGFLSGRHKPWRSTAYDVQSFAPSGGGGGRHGRPRHKRSVKTTANRPNVVSNARRHRRR